MGFREQVKESMASRGPVLGVAAGLELLSRQVVVGVGARGGPGPLLNWFVLHLGVAVRVLGGAITQWHGLPVVAVAAVVVVAMSCVLLGPAVLLEYDLPASWSPAPTWPLW